MDYTRTIIDRVELEARQFTSEITINERQLVNCKLSAFERRGQFGQELSMSLTAFIASKMLKKAEMKYPSSGWDLFKMYFFPKWLLKKFPVKYEYLRIEAREIYPDISIPEKQPFIILETFKNNLATDMAEF